MSEYKRQSLMGKEENFSAEKITAHFSVKKEDFLTKESVEENFKNIFNWRECQYDNDIKKNPSKKNMYFNLDTHNRIMLDYTLELMAGQNLSEEKKVAIIIAAIMHDSGKLSSGLLEHHLKGMEYIDRMFNEIKDRKINGIEISETIKRKVKEAVERHMNHPFLVTLNKEKKFPAPIDEIDKIIFDADMLANIGFKNVAFRLVDKKFLNDDIQKSSEKGTTVFQEMFENVMQGVRKMKETVLSANAQKIANDLVDKSENIFKYLKESNRLEYLQNIFSQDKGFNKETIEMHGGVNLIKKLLNEEIEKAAVELGIKKKIFDSFKM